MACKDDARITYQVLTTRQGWFKDNSRVSEHVKDIKVYSKITCQVVASFQGWLKDKFTGSDKYILLHILLYLGSDHALEFHNFLILLNIITNWGEKHKAREKRNNIKGIKKFFLLFLYPNHFRFRFLSFLPVLLFSILSRLWFSPLIDRLLNLFLSAFKTRFMPS